MKPAVIEFDAKKIGLFREAAFIEEREVAVVQQTEDSTLIGRVDVAKGDVVLGRNFGMSMAKKGSRCAFCCRKNSMEPLSWARSKMI